MKGLAERSGLSPDTLSRFLLVLENEMVIWVGLVILLSQVLGVRLWVGRQVRWSRTRAGTAAVASARGNTP
jgi:hypothetical protein